MQRLCIIQTNVSRKLRISTSILSQDTCLIPIHFIKIDIVKKQLNKETTQNVFAFSIFILDTKIANGNKLLQNIFFLYFGFIKNHKIKYLFSAILQK